MTVSLHHDSSEPRRPRGTHATHVCAYLPKCPLEYLRFLYKPADQLNVTTTPLGHLLTHE